MARKSFSVLFFIKKGKLLKASILDKYKDVAECTGKLLPVLSNQRMNSYLKEIADVCGLQKNLCTHSARHSYATSICLANGVSMENVAKMLGHADTSVTKHYARVLNGINCIITYSHIIILVYIEEIQVFFILILNIRSKQWHRTTEISVSGKYPHILVY